jgi:hypothetical protein
MGQKHLIPAWCYEAHWLCAPRSRGIFWLDFLVLGMLNIFWYSVLTTAPTNLFIHKIYL